MRIQYNKWRASIFMILLFVLFFLIGVAHHAYVSWRGGL